MKNYLLAGMLLISTPMLAQKAPASAASYPLKQANVAVVRTSDSLSVAYSRLTKALLSAGYGLEKVEKESGYLATAPQATADRKAVQASLRFTLLREPEGTVIEVRGTYAITGLLGSRPISNQGQKGSATAAAWAELERAAATYPAGILAYRREP